MGSRSDVELQALTPALRTPALRFAHPEAVGELAKMRRKEKDGELVTVSAADPLSLVGIVTPGSRLPASGPNRVLYRDGLPAAFHQGGELQFLQEMSPQHQWHARERLKRRGGSWQAAVGSPQ